MKLKYLEKAKGKGKLFTSISMVFVFIFLSFAGVFAYFTATSTKGGDIGFASVEVNIIKDGTTLTNSQFTYNYLDNLYPGSTISVSSAQVKNTGSVSCYALINLNISITKDSITPLHYNAWYDLSGNEIYTTNMAINTTSATLMNRDEAINLDLDYTLPGDILSNQYKEANVQVDLVAYGIQTLLPEAVAYADKDLYAAYKIITDSESLYIDSNLNVAPALSEWTINSTSWTSYDADTGRMQITYPGSNETVHAISPLIPVDNFTEYTLSAKIDFIDPVVNKVLFNINYLDKDKNPIGSNGIYSSPTVSGERVRTTRQWQDMDVSGDDLTLVKYIRFNIRTADFYEATYSYYISDIFFAPVYNLSANEYKTTAIMSAAGRNLAPDLSTWRTDSNAKYNLNTGKVLLTYGVDGDSTIDSNFIPVSNFVGFSTSFKTEFVDVISGTTSTNYLYYDKDLNFIGGNGRTQTVNSGDRVTHSYGETNEIKAANLINGGIAYVKIGIRTYESWSENSFYASEVMFQQTVDASPYDYEPYRPASANTSASKLYTPLRTLGSSTDSIDSSNSRIVRNVGRLEITADIVAVGSDYEDIVYASVPKQDNDYNIGNYFSHETYLEGKNMTQTWDILDVWGDVLNIGCITGSLTHYWIGYPKGTTLEEMKADLTGRVLYYQHIIPEYETYLNTGKNLWNLSANNLKYTTGSSDNTTTVNSQYDFTGEKAQILSQYNFTISFKIKRYSNDNITTPRITMIYYYSDGTSVHIYGFQNLISNDGKWQHIYLNSIDLNILNNGKTISYIRFRLGDCISQTYRNFEIKDIQLEIGNYPTDYVAYID